MPATNCTGNVPRRHQFAFSNSGGTTYVNRIAASNFGLRSTIALNQDQGNNGLLWPRDEDFVLDKIAVAGNIQFAARPPDLRWFLPLVFGTTFSGNVIKIGAQCPFFRVGHLDSVIDTVYNYVDCAMSKVTFSSSDSSGGTLQISADIEAASSNKSASSGWPTLTLASQQPFVHSHSVLTVDGVARRIKDVSVTIDNQLLTDEYYNSRYRGDFPSDGQLITLSHSTPFDTADDVALTNLTAGVAGSLVYTNGTVSVTFTFPNLRYLAPEPEIGQRGTRVMNTYQWVAGLAPGGNPTTDPPLTVTLDDTI